MWADPNLDCQKYQIDVEFLKVTFQVFIITKSQRNLTRYSSIFIYITQGTWKGWKGYNGTNQQVQRSNIAGECACRSGYYFDDISLSCQETTFDFNSVWIIVGFAIIIFISLLCCRFCLFGILRRQMIFNACSFYINTSCLF